MKKYRNDPNLQGKRRIFDQELHDKYDIPARAIIKKALGDFVIDNPDIYQQDLIVCDDTYKYKYIEIQVFTYWADGIYPSDGVFVYERKAKYDVDTLFITLNKEMDQCLVFDAGSFKFSKPRRIKKYGREFVYDVPNNRIVALKMNRLSPQFLRSFY